MERPPLPDYLQVAITEALNRGQSYLMRAQQPTGTWATSQAHAVGYTALPALTLLELGVPAKDPAIQRAAQFVRAYIPLVDKQPLKNTYEVALAVLFLDRLGDPKDKTNIEILTARLIAGQCHTGGWSYVVPVLNEKDTALILSLIRRIEPPPLQELLGGRLEGMNNPFVKNFPRKEAKPPETKKQTPVKIPQQLVDMPVMNDLEQMVKRFPLVDPEKASDKYVFATTDNSTTQFALLALWAGRRHKIPATRTGTLTFMRYHTSQASDGGWNYPYKNGGNGTTMTMINPGILGLAIGHGLVREMKLVDEPAVDEDPRLHQAFLALSRHIGEPQDRIKDLPMPNLYFLWSVERVAVLFNMHLIGNKDWYRWGAEALVANQNPESGHWEKSEYPGGNADNSGPINTSFALLFLKRANLAEDLSKYLTFSPKKLNDNVIKMMPAAPKPPPPKVEAKPEVKAPVLVAEAKPPMTPEPPPPETKVAAAPPAGMPKMMPPSGPPAVAPAPAPTSSGGWWMWVLIGVGGLLVVGGILAVVLMGSSGSRDADDEEEDEPRARKKKSKRR